MHVEQEEDEGYPSDQEMVDQDISFHNSQSSCSSYGDHQISEEENGSSDDEYIKQSDAEPEHEQSTDQSDDEVASNTKQQVENLDAEVRVKLMELQLLMERGGMSRSAALLASNGAKALSQNVNQDKGKGRKLNANTSSSGDKKPVRKIGSISEETIYDAVVKKQISSSSEDQDISDGALELEFNNLTMMHGNFSDDDHSRSPAPRESMSFKGRYSGEEFCECNSPPRPTPDQVMDKRIRDAEAAKAQIFPKPGKNLHQSCNFGKTSDMDESYMIVGAHVDTAMVEKMQKGEYVDFGKLIPKDRILAEEDQRLEMIIKGGRTYYVPVSESTAISSFKKWEQAFRVYSNIYTKRHPHRSAELIEYNHVINTIAMSYVWDNVYSYDKDFRIHMSRNPNRNWSIILQQAWTLCLRDHLNSPFQHNNSRDKESMVYGRGPQRILSRQNPGGATTREDANLVHPVTMITSVHIV